MEIRPADRIASFKPYYFAQLNRRLAVLREQNVDVIRLDMGSPDLPPSNDIIETLVDAAWRSDTHGYTPNGGTVAFRKAVVTYYQRRFQVKLDDYSEVLGLIGSKEGLFNLSQVLLNPGDLAIVPDPGYPVYSAGSIIAGAEIYSLPLYKENQFLPDLDSIPLSVAKQAKILWLNYPNNPTGATATLEFFEKVVDFAHTYGIVVAHDAPYADVCYDDYVAPSILQAPGAKEVAVEFNSLSKAYNMAGWRLGMAVGNRDIIRYLNIYKSQMDSSHFGPVYEAGVQALTGDQSWLADRNQIYRERRDMVLKALSKVGFTMSKPLAAIYIWARLPAGQHDTIDFCTRLLNDTGVSIIPGVVYGQHGEGYVRISLGGEATPRMKEALDRIVEWVKEKV